MADTLFKGKTSNPCLEERWPFCTVDTKHVAVEAINLDVQVSNQFALVSRLSIAPRARKSPRQDDYEVNMVNVKLPLVAYMSKMDSHS